MCICDLDIANRGDDIRVCPLNYIVCNLLFPPKIEVVSQSCAARLGNYGVVQWPDTLAFYPAQLFSHAIFWNNVAIVT